MTKKRKAVIRKPVPITVIITTKNEEKMIGACIKRLQDFDEIIVVDSNSADSTQKIAHAHGASVFNFIWNGEYPKKRGWCLKHLPLKNDWVFFVDADELMTQGLIDEIFDRWFKERDKYSGFFIKGQYVLNGKLMQHGLINNKLCLFHRDHLKFPVVNDLDCPGMGEIEGHYQPVHKAGYFTSRIGQMHRPLEHHAFYDPHKWTERHKRYAAWQRCMDRKKAWPKDIRSSRQIAKEVVRALPPMVRGIAMFLHSYVYKRGFMDGEAGYVLAKSRFDYYTHY